MLCLARLMRVCVFVAQLGEPLTEQQLTDMMREADSDGNGKIDFEEFCRLMFGTK